MIEDFGQMIYISGLRSTAKRGVAESLAIPIGEQYFFLLYGSYGRVEIKPCLRIKPKIPG